MKPDYAKATAELIDRLRKRKANENSQIPTPQAPQVYINSPTNCVIVIGPSAQPPRTEGKQGAAGPDRNQRSSR